VAIKAKQCIVAVVDDDPRIRESVRDFLVSAGFGANLFSSGREILKADDLEVSCCPITDVRMPEIDGWELQWLAFANFPSLAIILITAQQDDMSRKRALEPGASAVLYKPFDGEELLDTVNTAITRAQNQSNRL
jgi:FixJ family two-component response regulator